jgi:hypothetical protein
MAPLALAPAPFPTRSLAGRELVAWVPDEPADPSLFALEDSGGDGWDQFAVNKVWTGSRPAAQGREWQSPDHKPGGRGAAGLAKG